MSVRRGKESGEDVPLKLEKVPFQGISKIINT